MPKLRPVQIYDFTAFSRRTPTQQPPGDRLDAQFKAHADAIADLQLELEKLNQPLTRQRLDPGLISEIIAAVEASLAHYRLDAQLAAGSARADAAAAARTAAEARQAVAQAQLSVDAGARTLQARVAELAIQPIVATDAVVVADPPMPTPLLGPNTGGFFAADVAGATATAADYAQVAIEWSEHLPDTIPPNILAINAISGQHWSSRWWALRSASAFGMLSMLYCGASDVPPAQTLTGDPLSQGALYFDTNSQTMQVWSGDAWTSFGQPQKGVVMSLYYKAAEGQTVFPLGVGDLYGATYAIDPLDPNGVEVCVNGVRLVPDPSASLTTGDFYLDFHASTVTFARPLHLNELALFDILMTTSQVQPGAVAIKPLQNINSPAGTQDGTRTSFVLVVKSDGTNPVVAGPEELVVSVDGVMQEPGVQYVASGDAINFVTAPAPDSYVWISWFKTPVNNPA